MGGKPRVLVMGATGQVGSAVASLLSRNPRLQTVAAARTPAKAAFGQSCRSRSATSRSRIRRSMSACRTLPICTLPLRGIAGSGRRAYPTSRMPWRCTV